jgi:hypothetical protein
MTNKDLYLLAHPEKCPHGMQLPVMKKGGNPIQNQKEAGIVLSHNLCRTYAAILSRSSEGREVWGPLRMSCRLSWRQVSLCSTRSRSTIK